MAKKKDDDTDTIADAEAALARGETPEDTRTAAEKRSDAKAAADAESEPAVKGYTDGPVEGKTHRILVSLEGLEDQEYWTDPPLNGGAGVREVLIGGKPFDHVNTTPDGTWVYRCDRRN